MSKLKHFKKFLIVNTNYTCETLMPCLKKKKKITDPTPLVCTLCTFACQCFIKYTEASNSNSLLFLIHRDKCHIKTKMYRNDAVKN